MDALIYLLRHENADAVETEELLDFVKGPDFPTGGIIYNRKDILNAYATGRGSVVLRGRAEITDVKSGRQAIVISEIPYQLNKSNFVIKIAELVQNKVIVGIHDIRDESNKESVRIVIELKKDAFPKKILNQLYKLTPLQTSFAFNMIALGDRGRQPRLFNLKELLLEFVEHRREVVERRTRYDLRIAEERAHILEGLKIALDNIDAVIATIRAADTREQAKSDLMAKFGLSERQAQAILEMQLQRLAGLERQKIEDELAEKLALIADLRDILAKPERITTIIGNELLEVKEKFGDTRKTEVHSGAIGEFDPRDTIPNESVVVSLSKQSYVKRIKASAFRTQRRGGMGVTTSLKEEDEASILLSTRNHNDLLFFTNTGRAFRLRAYDIPETQRTAKGQPIVNLLALQPGEIVTAILDATTTDGTNLVLVSKKAIVKRLDRSDIENIRSNGLIVMKPREDDELQWVRMTHGTDNLLLVSEEGKAIQFNEDEVRVMGRAAAGVRGMKIKDSDNLVAADIVTPEHAYVFSVSELGYGKISPVDEYREQGRGGMGIKIGATSGKTGNIIFAALLTEEERTKGEVILISRGGQTIRLALSTVRKTSRVTQGVILAKIKAKDDALVSATIIVEGESELEEVPDTENLADSTAQ